MREVNLKSSDTLREKSVSGYSSSISSSTSSESPVKHKDESAGEFIGTLGKSAGANHTSGTKFLNENRDHVSKRLQVKTQEAEGICMKLYFILNDIAVALEQKDDVIDIIDIAGSSLKNAYAEYNLPLHFDTILEIFKSNSKDFLKTICIPCILRFFKWCRVRAQDAMFPNALVTKEKCYRFIKDDNMICGHDSTMIIKLIRSMKLLSTIQKDTFRSVDIVGYDSISVFQWEEVDVDEMEEYLFGVGQPQYEATKYNEEPPFQYQRESELSLREGHDGRSRYEEDPGNQQTFQNHSFNQNPMEQQQNWISSVLMSTNMKLQELAIENQQLREHIMYLNQTLQFLIDKPDTVDKNYTQSLESKLKYNSEKLNEIITPNGMYITPKAAPNAATLNVTSNMVDENSSFPFTYDSMNYIRTQQHNQMAYMHHQNTVDKYKSFMSPFNEQATMLDPIGSNVNPFGIAPYPQAEDSANNHVVQSDQYPGLTTKFKEPKASTNRGKKSKIKEPQVSFISKGKQFQPPYSQTGKRYLLGPDGNLNIIMKNDLDSVYSIYNEFFQSLKRQIDSFVQDHGRSRLAHFKKKRTFQKRKAFCYLVETIANFSNLPAEQVLDLIHDIRTQENRSVIWVCNNLNQLKHDIIRRRPEFAKFLDNTSV